MTYTHSEFVRLVIQMRNAQKNYFTTCHRNVLLQSKELESQVDHYAARLEAQELQMKANLDALFGDESAKLSKKAGEGDGC